MRSEPDSTPPASFERIVPQAPDARHARTVSRSASAANAGVSPLAVGLGLLALLVIGALAIVVLPGLVAPPSPPAPQAAATVPTAVPAPSTTGQPAPSTPAAKPAWDDPVLLQARADAQALQQQFAEQSARLQAQGVARWAADRYGKAVADAQTGEAAFKSKDFAAAKASYAAAVALTTTLVNEVPQRLQQALQEGLAALAGGDKAAAQAAFDLALAIDPANAAAQRGLGRLQSLDAVRAKLDTAARLEQAGDEAGAVAAYKAALDLDPDTTPAREALARIGAERADAEFRRQLGEAITALDRGDLGVAEARLARARALRASDGGVQQAGARLAEAQRSHKLAQLQSAAAAQAASEDWAGAVATYRKALEIDSSIAYARDGLAQAEPRAAMAARLQDFIDRPARLTAAAVAADAESALAQASSLSPAGPRLQHQIQALRSALDQAAQPVSVTLRSDNQTEVTIYRVGPQGRFADKLLSLKPGRYVAVGSRAGYRDVRREFDVLAGASALTVELRCEETL